MNFFKLFFLILSAVILSACAFNNRFHHPEKIELTIDELRYFNYGKDTTYFDYNQSTHEVTLSKPNQEIINKNYFIENVFFESTSGNRLNGWMLKPRNKKPIATILHLHGSGVNILFHYQLIDKLIQYGFQIFTFDYSGYGFSEGKATRKNALKDSYSALNFLKAQNEINKMKLLLYGHSYGGYLASVIGANKQDDIDGIIIEGAFSSHKDEAKQTSPIFGNFVKKGVLAENEIRKNHKPVLIIHSSEDSMVPFKFGEKIYNAANEPKMFYKIDGIHILGLIHYNSEIFNRIKKLMLYE